MSSGSEYDSVGGSRSVQWHAALEATRRGPIDGRTRASNIWAFRLRRKKKTKLNYIHLNYEIIP